MNPIDNTKLVMTHADDGSFFYFGRGFCFVEPPEGGGRCYIESRAAWPSADHEAAARALVKMSIGSHHVADLTAAINQATDEGRPLMFTIDEHGAVLDEWTSRKRQWPELIAALQAEARHG
jgi:hypothetical protein